MTTPGREQLVQGLDVGGDPGHQPAYRIPVEVADAQALEMAEDLHAQVVHHPLTEIGGQQGLAVLDQELEHQRGQKQDGQGAEQAGVAGGNGDVQRALGQSRAHQRQPGAAQQQQHREGRQAAVGPEIDQQPAQQPGVIALVERFVLIHGDAIRPAPRSADSSTPLRPRRTQPENTRKPNAMVK